MTAAKDILVVGAGLAGLVAARHLAGAGHGVHVVDKGRSVGGRLATRRMGDARLDHGAQFFTVRGDSFAQLVASAVDDGVVTEWCRGFDDPPDGHPRYTGTTGMNGIAKWLASGVSVQTNCRLEQLAVIDGAWQATTTDGATLRADAVVLTPPVPQTLELLDAGGTRLDPDTDAMLRSVSYFATLGLLATLDRTPAIPEPGGIQLAEDQPFTFVADNQRKGISTSPAITLHANHQYSAARYDDEPREVLDELLRLAAPWLGSASVLEAQLKKWRYAGPVEPLPDRTVLVDVAGAPAAFAGDAFGGPKVEGAHNSGMAAAERLVERWH